MYNVDLTRSAEKELLALDKSLVARVWEKIKGLSDDPHPRGSLKLSGTDNSYRLRIGDYRVIYRVSGDAITIVGISHRKQAYR